VGKAKGKVENACINFFKAGIDVCLTQDNHLGFSRILEVYLRVITTGTLNTLEEYFEFKLESVESLAAALEVGDSHGDRELESLMYFRSQLSGKAKGRRKEVSYIEDDMSEEGIPIGRPAVTAPAKRGRKGPIPGKGGERKKKASILESVHEDDSEGEEEVPKAAANKGVKKVVQKKPVPQPLPAEGSRRSSRGDPGRKISYHEGRQGRGVLDMDSEVDEGADSGEVQEDSEDDMPAFTHPPQQHVPSSRVSTYKSKKGISKTDKAGIDI
jgi:hypothetical protein